VLRNKITYVLLVTMMLLVPLTTAIADNEDKVKKVEGTLKIVGGEISVKWDQDKLDFGTIKLAEDYKHEKKVELGKFTVNNPTGNDDGYKIDLKLSKFKSDKAGELEGEKIKMKITKKPNNNRDVVKINENFYGNSTTFIDTTGEYGEEYMGNKDFVFGEESLEFSGDFTKARAGSDYKSTFTVTFSKEPGA